MNWFRRFDLEYWQMREALGFPIPNWVDRRWPRAFQGNAGKNPFYRPAPRPNADHIDLILTEDADVENGRLTNTAFLAVKIAETIERAPR